MSDSEELIKLLREHPEIELEARCLIMTIYLCYARVEKKRRLNNEQR